VPLPLFPPASAHLSSAIDPSALAPISEKDFFATLTQKQPPSDVLQREANLYMTSVKEARAHEEAARRERERRRRRVLVEQQDAQRGVQEKKILEELFGRLLKQSDEERRVADSFRSWRGVSDGCRLADVLKEKETMRLNREVRERQYEEARSAQRAQEEEHAASNFAARVEEYHRQVF
jgi:hypothetical protein